MRGYQRALTVAVCLALAASLSACGKKAGLRLNLKPGDTVTFEVRSDLKQTMGPMGEQKQQQVTKVVYNVESVDAQGVATVKATTDLSGAAANMGAAMGGAGGMGDVLSDLKSVELTMELAPDGTVKSLTGMAPIVDKMVAATKKVMEDQLANLPAEAKAMMGDNMFAGVEKGLRNVMGDEAVRQQMQGMTDFYPPEPVDVGDTWVKEQTLTAPFPVKASTTYTVTARGAGVMNIDYTSKLSPNPDGGMDMGMVKVKMDLSGEQKGTVQVDEATGWIKSSSGTLNVNGELDAGVMKSPVKIEGTVYIQAL